MTTPEIIGFALAIVVGYFLSCLRILYEYQRGVVFRLGRVLNTPKGPGLILVFWPIDRLVRVSLRTYVQDVPPQDVITRDNVSVKVNAVVYFRVMDPDRSVHRGGELRLRHPASSPRPPCAAWSARSSWTIC